MFSTSSTVNVPTSSGARSNRSGTRLSLGDEVTGAVVGVDLVVGVAGVEHRVEQLFLGFEVMQQPGRGHPGLLGDLRQRGVAPAVARQQPLGHGKNPLPAVLPLGEEVVGCDERLREADGSGLTRGSFVATNLVNTQ